MYNLYRYGIYKVYTATTYSIKQNPIIEFD